MEFVFLGHSRHSIFKVEILVQSVSNPNDKGWIIWIHDIPKRNEVIKI